MTHEVAPGIGIERREHCYLIPLLNVTDEGFADDIKIHPKQGSLVVGQLPSCSCMGLVEKSWQAGA